MYIYTLQGYFRESYLTEQAKVKLHFDGVGPGSLANIIYYLHLFAQKATICPENGFCYASGMFTRLLLQPLCVEARRKTWSNLWSFSR